MGCVDIALLLFPHVLCMHASCMRLCCRGAVYRASVMTLWDKLLYIGVISLLHIFTHTHQHTYTRIPHTHTCTHTTHIQTHTRMHTRTTHTHTHTHIHAVSAQSCESQTRCRDCIGTAGCVWCADSVRFYAVYICIYLWSLLCMAHPLS